MIFRVGEHNISTIIYEGYDYLLEQYRPFEIEEGTEGTEGVEGKLFTVEMVERIECEVTQSIFVDDISNDPRMVRINISQTSEGMLFHIVMPMGDVEGGRLHITPHGAHFAIREGCTDRNVILSAFNSAMILAYIHFSLPHNTLIMHASAVVKDGGAHLFIAKSGTGKSTHSQMWLSCFADGYLLNDDHPVVRCHDDGGVIAYGSPWSGKTPCYKNLSAPLAAVIRIKRAPHNRLKRLSALHAFASVSSSNSGMQWSEELTEAKRGCMERLISNVACYEMECLPNNEAALCCYETLCAER